MKRKFNSWSVRALSFAGRLLLIKTVIAGITNFWCSSFMLPKACIKRINSLCGVFLWKGNIEDRHTARVSWEVVTKPKTEGGLGVRNLEIWNKACILKLIWLLFFEAGLIWVAWCTETVLNGDLNSFWTVKPSTRNSWLVNKLLKLRSEIYDWIKLRVRNGETCRLWTDNWSTFGCLKSYLATDLNSSLGIRENATLSSLFRNNHWNLPHPRSEKQLQLHTFLTTVELTTEEDFYEWELEGNIQTTFSTGKVYAILSRHGENVPWVHIVGIVGGIPKHSFLCRLFLLNRCPTRDRLLSWGLLTSPTCLLCNSSPESCDHLYFLCPYSWSLWFPLARRCGLDPQQQWTDITTQLQSYNSRNRRGRLILLTWQCCISCTWQERNNRLHRNTFRSVDVLTRLIDRQIRDRILSYRERSPRLSSKMKQQWLA